MRFQGFFTHPSNYSATKNAPAAGHNYQEIRSGLAAPSQFWREIWADSTAIKTKRQMKPPLQTI
jgi:hypothetical protein